MGEATSNTAVANTMIPVMVSLSIAAGINPVPPAIGATLGGGRGSVLPASAPLNAIAYDSGMISVTKMIWAGVLFDIFSGFSGKAGTWDGSPLGAIPSITL